MSTLLLPHPRPTKAGTQPTESGAAAMRLVTAVQSLSLARNMESIIEIVRKAARDVSQADGATFVLREGELCHYVDEYAMTPLWKGRRFPLASCISGWAMLNRKAAVIEDIYEDQRIPHAAYRPTFVKSLIMVPIRTEDPIGAIGIYWAHHHAPDQIEVELLQALANTTSVAMENVRLYTELEQRVRDRTRQLEEANRELETFSYSISHDLRAPLRAMIGFSTMLKQAYAGQLDANANGYLDRISTAGRRMNKLIEDVLCYSQTSRTGLTLAPIDPVKLITEIVNSYPHLGNSELELTLPGSLPRVLANESVLTQCISNILTNAVKFVREKGKPHVEIWAESTEGKVKLWFKDNGIGIAPEHFEKIFDIFQRLDPERDGNGIGLSIVKKAMERMGGTVEVRSELGQGTSFGLALQAAKA